jgi:hypothetical protein
LHQRTHEACAQRVARLGDPGHFLAAQVRAGIRIEQAPRRVRRWNVAARMVQRGIDRPDVRPHERARKRHLARRELDRVVDVEELAQAKHGRIERALGGGAVGVGPKCGHQEVGVDVLAFHRDHELQELERALLRLSREAHRFAVARQLESAQRANPQPERPLRPGVVRCDQ